MDSESVLKYKLLIIRMGVVELGNFWLDIFSHKIGHILGGLTNSQGVLHGDWRFGPELDKDCANQVVVRAGCIIHVSRPNLIACG